ncbi:MAG: hypothetical protein QM726_12780 [Chitinophagaceae bacterium]
MTTKEYQKFILPRIKHKLKGLEVISEWTAFQGYKNHYSPRVDIAVGPFSIQPGNNQMQEYNKLIQEKNVKKVLNELFKLHVKNLGEEPLINELVVADFNNLLIKNQNARCFLAIEIENENSKKHIMGSLINASSLGRVGIGVAYSEKTFRTFIRILNYLAFLKRVGKNTYDTTNFLIVKKDQMVDLISN